MVKYLASELDRTFAALADPTRRALLARLTSAPELTVSELSRPFALSLPAVMKHLEVLTSAGLITRNKRGRSVSCAITAAPLATAQAWLAHYQAFWTPLLEGFAAVVAEETCSTSPVSRSRAGSKRRRPKSSRLGPTRS